MEIFGLRSIMIIIKRLYLHINNKVMNGLLMLGKDLEASLMDENMVLEIG
jgi:hypothetical protein